jgi:hypothetical protein
LYNYDYFFVNNHLFLNSIQKRYFNKKQANKMVAQKFMWNFENREIVAHRALSKLAFGGGGNFIKNISKKWKIKLPHRQQQPP